MARHWIDLSYKDDLVWIRPSAAKHRSCSKEIEELRKLPISFRRQPSTTK